MGVHLQISIAENHTGLLWQQVMPFVKRNFGGRHVDLYSVELYPSNYFMQFDQFLSFEKWAAMTYDVVETIPEGWEVLEIPAGLYVVFTYRGDLESAPTFYGKIFGEWIPQSVYDVDHRPHFALMGEKYIHDHPDSEEEIWVPILAK